MLFSEDNSFLYISDEEQGIRAMKGCSGKLPTQNGCRTKDDSEIDKEP